jgi:hypothetical protein
MTQATGTKRCPRCEDEKPTEAFSRNRAKPDGLSHWCRACNAESKRLRWESDPDTARATARAAYWRHAEKNKARNRRRYREEREKVVEQQRRSKIKRAYGLTVEEYDAIIARGCAICRTQEGRICLDHDHATGQVRDALCEHCNRGLGHFRDRPDLLAVAADYLKEHRAD